MARPDGEGSEGMKGLAAEVREVRFPSGSGYCVGDLLLPEGRKASRRAPVVVLGHGIGSERTFGLRPFAERFVARGIAALVFDYRHFGDSPGEPRCLVSAERQVEDYLAAMAFVRHHPELDGGRIALWGTSFSGGHVLVAASRHPAGLRAVVSQIPFVSGLASTFAYPLRYHLPAVLLGLADRLGSALGLPPLTVPVVRTKGLALLASPDSHAGYMALVPPESDWPGRIPARVFLEVLRYHPSRSAMEVAVPTLVLAAGNDAICPVGAAQKSVRRMPDVRFECFPIGHFDAYHGPWFEEFVHREADFLEEHLIHD